MAVMFVELVAGRVLSACPAEMIARFEASRVRTAACLATPVGESAKGSRKPKISRTP